MKILVISGNYPSNTQPNNGAFVYNLMQELARKHEVFVIAPYKAVNLFKRAKASYGAEECHVLRPLYFSFSNKKFLNFNTRKLTNFVYKKTVERGLKTYGKRPDVVYAHFLSNAIAILDFTVREKIPLVIASGESTYDSWFLVPKTIQEKLKRNFSHIICVSKENKDQLAKIGFDADKMSVIPNAVNYELFKPLNKQKCKERLGIDKSKFVVGFIGHFIHRKGPNRIIKAIEELEDNDIELVCVGSKGNLINNTFTKIIKPVPNNQLPEIYNAFDVFVLPTLYEGSCNVIEEAKACGIPIISSKGTSVEEQVEESFGFLINPMNIREIAETIKKLKNDHKLHNNMVNKLIKLRGANSIINRASKIYTILEYVRK